VVEGARLESVYTPKVYQEFESLSLRKQRLHSYDITRLQNCRDYD
jgi:hypothetical protein